MIPRLNHPHAWHYHPRRHHVAGYALLAVVVVLAGWWIVGDAMDVAAAMVVVR